MVVRRTRLGISMQGELSTLSKHAVDVFGFLIPMNTSITSGEFSNLIKGYSQHPKAEIVANHLLAA